MRPTYLRLLLVTLAIGLVIIIALLLFSESEEPGPDESQEPTASPAEMETPALSAGPADELVMYDNPVYRPDFPDPFILPASDRYYAFSTNAGTVNVPAIVSEDLLDWEFVGDALPRLPEWAAIGQSLTWAPGVLPREASYVLYYTARFEEAGRQCISRAVSAQPQGPYVDDSTEPFICQLDLGGSIDPYPFVDVDGTPYLLWKNDGNCCNLPVKLWIQELSADGLSLTGEPVELIERDQAWERPLIENPAMWAHEGDYYLFYSGNWWESHEYAVGYAVCETVTGPCTKPQQEPIFSFTPEVMGPGGQALFTDREGNLWLAYHAWTGANVGYTSGGSRSLRIDPVTFENGEPVIHGPTEEPQPLP